MRLGITRITLLLICSAYVLWNLVAYFLSNRFELCGYKKLPYGLMDKSSKDCTFMGKDEFGFLYRLAAGMEMDTRLMSDEERGWLKEFIRIGALIETSDAVGCVPAYRKYPSRYKQDVQWSITGDCNLKCRHCFMSAPDCKFGVPTLEECLEVVRQLDECGVRRVALTGGEPLVRNDFWDIVDALVEHDIRISTVFSNGWLINQELLDGFKDRKLHPAWQISFDGLGHHDWLRGVDGAEQRAIEAIKLVAQNGFTVSCAVSVFKDNLDTFNETLEFLASLGVRSVKTGYMQAQGEWLKYPEQWLSEEEELEFYQRMIPRYLQRRPLDLQCEGLFMGYSDATLNGARERGEKPSNSERGDDRFVFFMERTCTEEVLSVANSCEVLAKSFYISSEGRVLPCMSLDGTPLAEGLPTLFDMPLREILTDSPYTAMADVTAREVLQHSEECAACEYRGRCCSGCRAMAVGADGVDFLAMDKRNCAILKNDWIGRIRNAIDSFVPEHEKRQAAVSGGCSCDAGICNG